MSATAGTSFLLDASANRADIADDPDRWENLDSDEETERPQQQQQQQQQQHRYPSATEANAVSAAQLRESAVEENEGYSAFLTHRRQTQETQEQQEDRYVEDLGSRLFRDGSQQQQVEEEEEKQKQQEAVRQREIQEQQMLLLQQQQQQQRQKEEEERKAQQLQQQKEEEERKAQQLQQQKEEEERKAQQLQQQKEEEERKAQQLQQQQQQQHYSVRQGRPPLAALLANQQSPAANAHSRQATPAELHVGFLQLDSGHVVGPFRWNVEEVGTPASLEGDQASVSRASLLSIVSSEVPGQRLVARRGRLQFGDSPSSPTGRSDTEASAEESLRQLSDRISELAGRPAAGQRDTRLTQLLADCISKNGVSMTVACAAGHRRGQNDDTEAKLQAEAKAAEASEAQQKLLQALVKQVESLKGENTSLREQLKEAMASAESSAAAAAAAERQVSGKTRPQSKGSYASLYEMLQEYMQENETLRTENADLAKFNGDWRQQQQQLAEENRQLSLQLDRAQRQLQQARAAAANQQKPIYVVSNSESRASSNQKAAASRLPPIRRREAPQPAPSDAESEPAIGQDSLRYQQHQLPQRAGVSGVEAWPRSQPQPLPQPLPQPPHPPPPPAQRQQQQQQQQHMYTGGHYHAAPVQLASPRQQLQQQQQQQWYGAQPQQQEARHYPDAPLHLPRQGERTYRNRFQAARGGQQQQLQLQQRHQEIVDSPAVQDANRLNESLRSELRQLDGAIQQHQRVNALQSDIRRGEGRKVLRTF